jgi:NifB/MoaA-like Fe-S oxidoreductase
MEKDQDIVSRYVPDEDLAMEFFTEIKGKKNKKKKIVCYYNVKSKVFYR